MRTTLHVCPPHAVDSHRDGQDVHLLYGYETGMWETQASSRSAACLAGGGGVAALGGPLLPRWWTSGALERARCPRGGGGAAGPGPCMRPPPPPRVLKDSAAGAMAPTAPNFLSRAQLKGVLCLWSLRPLRLSSRQRREIAIIAYVPLYPHGPKHTHTPLRCACGSSG